MIILKSVNEVYSLKFYNDNQITNENIFALKDVSLKINQGEIVNVIGANGSGKSTLLKVICGVIEPYDGYVSVLGKVGLIIDIGCGFHPDLTGRENILASAPLYGYSKEDVILLLPKIIEFSELGKYFDAPIRTYSQGMYLRLAFSYAIIMNPDILCIDDIITVGDESYREKCLSKITEFKNKGKTIILVTHDLYFASEFADRTIWINEGEILFDGDTLQAIEKYKNHIKRKSFVGNIEFSPFHFIEKDNLLSIYFNNIEFAKIIEIFSSDKNVISFKNKDNNSEELSFNKLEMIEKGRHYIKWQEIKTQQGIMLEITAITKGEALIIEYFIKNILGALKGEIVFEVNLPLLLSINDFIAFDSDYINLYEKNECCFNIENYNKYLNIEFTPPVLKRNITVKNKSIIKLLINGELPLYNETSKRILNLKFNLKNGRIKEKDFFNEKELDLTKNRIGNKDSFIQFAGHGFFFIRNSINLFVFNGIEFLFTFNGIECSSNNSEVSILNVDENNHAINLLYKNLFWPLEIMLNVKLKNQNHLSLTFYTNYKNNLKIENLRLQILFDFYNVCKNEDFSYENSNLVLLEHKDEFINIENKSDDDFFIFYHDYKDKNRNALVVYLLDKNPYENYEYKLDCIFNKEKDLTCYKKFEKKTGVLDFVNGKIGIKYFNMEVFSGWKNYVSILSDSIWHDSLKCSWSESIKGVYIGKMPWIPVVLEIKISMFDNEKCMIDYYFICEKDVYFNKCEIVYPINENFNIINNESSLGEAFMEFIKNGLNLNQLKLLFFLSDKKISFSFKSELLFMVNLSKSLYSQKTLKITFNFDNKCFNKGKYELGSAEFYPCK